MKILKFKLPVSGCEFDVDSEPMFGDMDDIENFVLNNTSGHIEDKEWKSEFKGDVLNNLKYFKAKVLVKGIYNEDGNRVNGDTIDLVRAMNPKDGEFLLNKVEEVITEYKKKLS